MKSLKAIAAGVFALGLGLALPAQAHQAGERHAAMQQQGHGQQAHGASHGAGRGGHPAHAARGQHGAKAAGDCPMQRQQADAGSHNH